VSATADARPPAAGLTFIPRRVPRPATAVAGVGAARLALLHRLVALGDQRRGQLRVAAGADVVIVLGPTDALPWVDGAQWLGADDDAPSLLLPTALDPSWPLDLLQARVLSARGGRTGAVAVLAASKRLIATGPASGIDVEVVREVIAAAEAAG
jgi:hypothetical protein